MKIGQYFGVNPATSRNFALRSAAFRTYEAVFITAFTNSFASRRDITSKIPSIKWSFLNVSTLSASSLSSYGSYFMPSPDAFMTSVVTKLHIKSKIPFISLSFALINS